MPTTESPVKRSLHFSVKELLGFTFPLCLWPGSRALFSKRLANEGPVRCWWHGFVVRCCSSSESQASEQLQMLLPVTLILAGVGQVRWCPCPFHSGLSWPSYLIQEIRLGVASGHCATLWVRNLSQSHRKHWATVLSYPPISPSIKLNHWSVGRQVSFQFQHYTILCKFAIEFQQFFNYIDLHQFSDSKDSGYA